MSLEGVDDNALLIFSIFSIFELDHFHLPCWSIRCSNTSFSVCLLLFYHLLFWTGITMVDKFNWQGKYIVLLLTKSAILLVFFSKPIIFCSICLPSCGEGCCPPGTPHQSMLPGLPMNTGLMPLPRLCPPGCPSVSRCILINYNCIFSRQLFRTARTSACGAFSLEN